MILAFVNEMWWWCGVCTCQCEVSTVLSRFGVKALSDLVRKTNVSVDGMVDSETDSCTLASSAIMWSFLCCVRPFVTMSFSVCVCVVLLVSCPCLWFMHSRKNYYCCWYIWFCCTGPLQIRSDSLISCHRRSFRRSWSRIFYSPNGLPVAQPAVSKHWTYRLSILYLA